MKWSDIFIQKPVLSIVVSLLILLLGFKAVKSLPVNQYPKTENALVTITTAYFGADPATVAPTTAAPASLRTIATSKAPLPLIWKMRMILKARMNTATSTTRCSPQPMM